MELQALAILAAGMRSLAELERTQPELGAEFGTFIRNVGSACWDAYTNFSRVLNKVIALREPVEPAAYDALSSELAATYDHQWFKEIAEVCARLRAAEQEFGKAIEKQANRPLSGPAAERYTLRDFLAILRQHEGSLEHEIQNTVRSLQLKLSEGMRSGDVSAAKNEAGELQSQIEKRLREIQQTVQDVLGTSASGARAVLGGWDKKAEQVLRADPNAQLKLNAFILVALVSLGTAVLQVIPIYAFPLVTGFALTGVVVLNAFQLFQSGKLSEASFLQLMKLALLNFFAPLAGKVGRPAASDKSARGG